MTNRSVKKIIMSPRTQKQFEEIRENRKKTILDSALKVFARDGYHNASISKISKHAGISKGLLYNYFESKEELLKILIGSLLDKEIDVLNQLLEKPFSDQSFTELIKLGTQILKQNPQQWLLYFTMSTQPEVMEIIQDKFTPERIQFADKILGFYKEKGHKDPMLTAQYFSMTMAGFKLSFIMNPEHFPVDEMEKLLINQFVK